MFYVYAVYADAVSHFLSRNTAKHKKASPIHDRDVMSFTRCGKRALINKTDDLLISTVVIQCIIYVLKHITYHGVVSVKVLLIKILSAYGHFKSSGSGSQSNISSMSH